MRRLTTMLMLASLSACGDAPPAGPPQCAARTGYYLYTFKQTEGTCGELSEQSIAASDDPGSWTDATCKNDVTSGDAGCSEGVDVKCLDGRAWTVYEMWDMAGDSMSGDYALHTTIGGVACASRYTMTAVRDNR